MDEFPGDRASSCGGILAPVKAQMKQDKIVLVYVCRNCGMERRNRSAPDDQMEAILELMRTGFVKID